MSSLARLKRRNIPATGTDKTDRSPFVGFVSTQGSAFPKVEDRQALDERATIPAALVGLPDADREAREERAAILEFEAGMTRAEAERLAGPPLEAVSWPQ